MTTNLRKSGPPRPSVKVTGWRLVLPTCVSAFALANGLGCARDNDAADEQVETAEARIINGNTVTRGSLSTLGVVKLGGCTGTLVTNQHVLTARHCVREWLEDVTPRVWRNLKTPITVTLEGATAADDQVRNSSRVFEPAGLNPPVSGDYSIIELDRPMVLAGSTDGYFQGLWPFADSTLKNKSVTCTGYGYNVEANATTWTSGTGDGNMHTATMTVSDANGGEVHIDRNASDQVGAPGDSGSTCWASNLTGQIYPIGVQSTCYASSWVDLNNDTKETNNEWTHIAQCQLVSADTIRPWFTQQIMTDLSLTYSYAPALPAGATAHVSVYTPDWSTRGSLIDITQGSATLAAFAPRSGLVEIVPHDGADDFMCTRFSVDAPLDGSLSLSGSCLNYGLLPILLTAS